MTAPRLLGSPPSPAAALAAILEPVPPAEALALLAAEAERQRAMLFTAGLEAVAGRFDRIAAALEREPSAPAPSAAAALPPAKAPPRPGFIGVLELAELLGLGVRTVRRHIAAGKIPRPVKLGGALRWDRRTVEGWIGEGCLGLARRK